MPTTQSFTDSSVVDLSGTEGACLINLSRFGASPTITVQSRIPKGQSGIYAFFRGFQLPNDASRLKDEILNAINAPKFQTRTGIINPYFQVSVGSKTALSEAKRPQLERAFESADFRETIRVALRWHLFFQTPLYIGKSTNLQARLSDHLAGKTELRHRLNEAGLDIDQCSILVMPVLKTLASMGDQVDSVEQPMETEIASNDSESLFEEVFSRLFSPSFTIRLG